MRNTIHRKQRLIDLLVEFKMRIQSNNRLGLFDVNLLSQEFLTDLLNELFHEANSDFECLDKLKSNYPAIDIADFTTNITYQITSQNDTTKIYDTIASFKLYYPDLLKSGKLRFIILNDINWTDKQWDNIKERYKESELEYDNSTIYSIAELEKEIGKASVKQQDKIIELLETELHELGKKSKKIESNEDDILRKELYSRFQHFYLSPWKLANSKEELEFKRILKDKDPLSAELMAEEKYEEILELWAPLKGFELFEINHPYWSDKPFFRRFIQAAKMDISISCIYQSLKNYDGTNIAEGVKILTELLTAPTFSTTGGSDVNLPREVAIHENSETILYFEKIEHVFREIKTHWGYEVTKKLLNLSGEEIEDFVESIVHKKAILNFVNS